MSSKRGRKRNDNLPPNRARDVQRAFRARRAAHLQALEERVQELEDENNTLRAALNLPPANRPPLGKGPTGKDKPKPYAPRNQQLVSPGLPPASIASTSALPPATSLASLAAITTPTMPPLPSSSRTDSPSSGSTRTHSLSPASLGAVLNPPNAQQATVVSVDTRWEEGLFGGKRAEMQPSPISTSYPVTPVSAQTSQIPFPFSSSAGSGSRPPQFAMSMTQNYPHTADRPMDDNGSSYTDPFLNRRFSFSQPQFPSSHDTSHGGHLHAQSPTCAVPPMPPQRGNSSLSSPITYAHRRSITDPQQTLSNVLLGESHPMQHGGGRLPTPPGGSLPEGVGHLRAAEFSMDARVGRMSS